MNPNEIKPTQGNGAAGRVQQNGHYDLDGVPPPDSNQIMVNSDEKGFGGEKIAQGLSGLLADSYMLYLRTQNFHWNVTGPMFFSLHQLFMLQYQELAIAVDLIAERIRALGFAAPGTFAEFSAISTFDESKGVPTAEGMIELLYQGHVSVALTARQVGALAEKQKDLPTVDLLTQRLNVHEKAAWMLRSSRAK